MILAFVLASIVPAACHTVAAGHIYARDLAAADSVFAVLPPQLELGFAPAPGQTRVFHPAELRHLALVHQIEAEFPNDICFGWRMTVPSRDAILFAISKTLAGRSAQVELLEQSALPAPAGEIVFPLTGLTGVSEQGVFWRGYVDYAEEKHFAIWARVQIRVRENHVVPTDTLRPDLIITSDQLRLAPYEGPLLRDKVLIDLSSVIGTVPRRPLPAGIALIEGDVDKPRDVERGDIVQVIAEEGRARIETQGFAESGGRRGSVISIRNPTSGKRFRARVADKDKVLVIPGTSSGLAVEGRKL